MFIHEYQAKSLLSKAQIPIPEGKVIETIEEAEKVLKGFSFDSYAIKAQIHGGGRGKAGGIKITYSSDEALEAVRAILGKRLITSQTGPDGKIVRKILIEEGIKIEREIYIAITIDRKRACPIVMVSPEGGMDIEGRKIFEEEITTSMGLYPFQRRRLAYSLGMEEEAQGLDYFIENLYRIFRKYDSTLLEINPLAIDHKGRMVVLDAKMGFDDNSLFRQKELLNLWDPGELNPLENEASRESLSYVMMDGNIGCLVNGAGLAMATIDLIDHYGGKAANFLDVGGGASAEKIEKSIGILFKDRRMKVLLINIFGGILRCDRFAEGLVKAMKNEETVIPIVIRFKGTMLEKGREIILNSGLNLIWAASMEESVRLAMEHVHSD
jgi:succinyl-CoA synthetase beta subunit